MVLLNQQGSSQQGRAWSSYRFQLGVALGSLSLLLAGISGCGQQAASEHGTSGSVPVTLKRLSEGGFEVVAPTTVTSDSIAVLAKSAVSQSAVSKSGTAQSGQVGATVAPKTSAPQAPPQASQRVVMPQVTEPFVTVQLPNQPAKLVNTSLMSLGFMVAWSPEAMDISWSAKMTNPVSVIMNGKVVASDLPVVGNHFAVAKPPQGTYFVQVCPTADVKASGVCAGPDDAPEEEPGFAKSTKHGVTYGLLVKVGTPGEQDKTLKQLRADYAQKT